ncbi:hypothetical protein EHM76_06740 [bacterium]|nr:MAG: hypothetical protein EHM76_06740 [bacterium]
MPGLISIDGAVFRSSLQTMLRQLDSFGKAGAAALDIAMVEYAEKLLNEMKQNITHKGSSIPTYFLAKSGHINGPRKQGEWTVVEIQWDAPYANIQDKGGEIFAKDVTAATNAGVKSQFTPTGRVRKSQIGMKIRGALGRYISRKRFNTARLFVPLRPGVRPIQDPAARAAMGYVWGVDYVLARSVTIKGSEFITKVLKKHAPNAARDIGIRAEQIWYSMTEKK